MGRRCFCLFIGVLFQHIRTKFDLGLTCVCEKGGDCFHSFLFSTPPQSCVYYLQSTWREKQKRLFVNLSRGPGPGAHNAEGQRGPPDHRSSRIRSCARSSVPQIHCESSLCLQSLALSFGSRLFPFNPPCHLCPERAERRSANHLHARLLHPESAKDLRH